MSLETLYILDWIFFSLTGIIVSVTLGYLLYVIICAVTSFVKEREKP